MTGIWFPSNFSQIEPPSRFSKDSNISWNAPWILKLGNPFTPGDKRKALISQKGNPIPYNTYWRIISRSKGKQYPPGFQMHSSYLSMRQRRGLWTVWSGTFLGWVVFIVIYYHGCISFRNLFYHRFIDSWILKMEWM